MKKLFLVLVVVATVSLGLNMKVNASTREIGREIKNILDLTNFKMDFETLEFNTINPIIKLSNPPNRNEKKEPIDPTKVKI